MDRRSNPVYVVFDVESEDLMPLGVYVQTDEAVVEYRTPEGAIRMASVDCVKVVPVSVFPAILPESDPDFPGFSNKA